MHPVLAARLRNQHLARPSLSAAEVVASMAAIQAQDYAGATWALGLRVPGAIASTIERALEAGEIVRTHPMRGTHHFVARDDVRWMLALLAPRGLVRSAGRWRELGLDAVTLRSAMRALGAALEGGKHLVRDEVAAVLRRARISPEGQRLAHVIFHAELTGLVCSGARRGKQITIALLDERVPAQPARARDAALAELARRYFTTRGPATLRDFVWWSGLTMADARAGAAQATGLVSETIDGAVYWRGASRPGRATGKRAYLLPPYDEYAVAYQRRALLGSPPAGATSFAETTLLGPIVVVDGVVVGTWKRTIGPRAVQIDVSPWRRWTSDDAAAVEQAAERYAAFIDRPAELRSLRRASRS
ncbi:MAG TPA: winged helix DNA-binding domain-containing protein [Kofleriaceae bacterium]|nr:winged helix DNA-binding domain-containing protein [Kofleriaceae bacterium]